MARAPEPVRSFLIWGGGGHGKVVADVVRALGHAIIGYVDRDPAKLHQAVEPGGARVVLTEGALLATVQAQAGYPLDANAIALAVGGNAARQRCYHQLGTLDLPALVHPSAICSPSARVGGGSVVFPLAVLNADARVGAVVVVNSGAIVEHDCVLADAVHISPGATLGGGVRVGERSWIGAGATVIHGISVGSDVVVGAGAVIIRDVPDGVTIVGNPGRVLDHGTSRRRGDYSNS